MIPTSISQINPARKHHQGGAAARLHGESEGLSITCPCPQLCLPQLLCAGASLRSWCPFWGCPWGAQTAPCTLSPSFPCQGHPQMGTTPGHPQSIPRWEQPQGTSPERPQSIPRWEHPQSIARASPGLWLLPALPSAHPSG